MARPVIAPDGTRYPSAGLAAGAEKVTGQAIAWRCNHGRAGWYWADEPGPRPRPLHRSSRPVVAPDGREYPSLGAAARAEGVTKSCITARCRRHIFGWRWA